MEIIDLLNQPEVGNQLAYLRARWSDEREYEDFGDYEAAMRRTLEAAWMPVVREWKGQPVRAFTFLRLNKNPFSMVVIEDKTGKRFKVWLKAKGRSAYVLTAQQIQVAR